MSIFCDYLGRPGVCIGSSQIFTLYALTIIVGALAGAYVAARQARLNGSDPDVVWDAMIWVVVAGIIGARLYHVLSTPAGCAAEIKGCGWPWYQNHPIDIIGLIREGGLGIYGAVIGGALAAIVYARIKKLPAARYLDFVAPGILLGQAIGRWGNFVNQELYGPPTDLPWGISIDAVHRTYGYVDLLQYPEGTTRFHPLFLYESMLNLLGFAVLAYVAWRLRRSLKVGDVILMYVVWYGLVRILVESYRFDAWTSFGNIPTATLVSILGAVTALIVLAARHWPRRTAAT